MTLPFTLSWPDFSFWGWVWFFLGAGIAGFFLLKLGVIPLADLIFRRIGRLKKADHEKSAEWKDERNHIASGIIKMKHKEKLAEQEDAAATALQLKEKEIEHLYQSFTEEVSAATRDFDRRLAQHQDDVKSEYFSELGLYCGLLSFFRSIEEDENEDYYCLKILGVPVVNVRSEELLGGESAQIDESRYLDHTFLAQYVMPVRDKTKRLTAKKDS